MTAEEVEAGLAAELAADGESVTAALDMWSVHSPMRVFIHYGEHGLDLSYAEAKRATDTIAGNLDRAGIRRGDRVVVHCRSAYATALWMFGIWKAGAVYCPLDPEVFGDALLDRLDAIQPALVVTERGQVAALEAVRRHLTRPPRLTVHDAVGPRPPHGYPEIPYGNFLARAIPPAVAIDPADTGMIVFTAGVTGRPKASVLPHRWLAAYTLLLRRLTTPDDVVHVDLPLHTAVGAFAGVARAAWAGATVSLWDRFHPVEFWRRVVGAGATGAVLTDHMVGWLSGAPERRGEQSNPLTKVLIQPLPPNHHAFARRFGIDTVVAAYGQVETGLPIAAVLTGVPPALGTPPSLRRGLTDKAVAAVCARLGVPVVDGAAIVRKGCLGAPLPFARVAVLDDYDRPCPRGVVGHLAIRPHLPGLLVQEYLDDPLSIAEATRNLWFHTGDAAVFDEEDGLLHFVDRVVDRIRIRGENVSAYHIEDLVNQHPDIAVGAVFGVPADARDEDEVVLYAEPEPGRALDPDELRAWCAQSLPAYMRPTWVRVVARMPRTPNGRVEKYRLRRHFLGLTDRPSSAVRGVPVPAPTPAPASRPALAPALSPVRSALPPSLPPGPGR
ncbi:AMP-binding protein [Streptomyces sp. SID3343]|uniref:AMP-binding protein n=1 Tax=Streptomyces sp. SID3343 TaxID=2690260 RepID=UPI0013714975|nr:AMP-binding protein [Streptomyces sp. SID3343]MYW01284.1 AMP-binding protein [Streptomyces sp. SID3343]